MTGSLPSVFVIGSSTTLLMDPYLEQMLRGVCSYSRKGRGHSDMREALRDLDAARGAGAGDSGMVLDYLHTLDREETFRPDVVLLHVGFHDIKTDPRTRKAQVPLNQFRENVDEIVGWFEKRGIRLIWMRPGPLDENLHNARCSGFLRFESDLHTYNEAAERVVQGHGIAVLDLAGLTQRLGPMDQLLKDHVHFVDDVVRQQAAFVVGYLTRHFLQCPATTKSVNGE